MHKRFFPFYLILILIFVITHNAYGGDIYRYIDPDGVMHYTHTPNTPGYKLFLRETNIEEPPLTEKANSEQIIHLKKEGGIFRLPVRINNTITLDFILDSGASEVCIPADVIMTLLRTHTIAETDFLPGKSFSLADGSVVQSPRLIIHELAIGDIKVLNVPTSVAPVRGALLLGQSFLQKLDSWSIDNHRCVLIVGSHRNREKSETITPK